MAKTKVSEWDSNASGNTDINGININEGCPPSTINNAIRETMAQVKDLVDGSSGDSLTNSGTVNITGNLQMDGSSGTSGQLLTSAGTGNTPTWTTLTTFVSGMIMLWSGSEASIPSGWSLCDGTNSTPDLRNRFVVGAGDTYAVDATGGSKDAIVVSHTHTGTTSSNGSHSHTGIYFPGSEDDNPDYGNSSVIVNNLGGTSTTISSSGTGTVGNHNHTFTTASTGSSGTNANLPPYYALAYIMKD